jgi:hypothetical protein
MYEFVASVESMTNPPSVCWQDLFISRFVGILPDTVTEVRTLLVISPSAVTPGTGAALAVSGFFEYSSDGTFANLGRVSGTLDPTTREFTLHDHSPHEAWAFTGALSRNGRVMHVRATYEGYTTDAFPLIHEDTAAQLIPNPAV